MCESVGVRCTTRDQLIAGTVTWQLSFNATEVVSINTALIVICYRVLVVCVLNWTANLIHQECCWYTCIFFGKFGKIKATVSEMYFLVSLSPHNAEVLQLCQIAAKFLTIF